MELDIILKIAKSRYFIIFIVIFGAILFEFDYYLNIEWNESVYQFALGAGLAGALIGFMHKKGKVHFGTTMFLIGFILLLVAGVPLAGGASFGDGAFAEKHWVIQDEQQKIILAVVAFVGLVLIIINYKAYAQNWIFARPMK
jgi:hypothetical protein